jgi:sterol desaturase/sphingolipid hydroxylase (fatty acid hydroxylase superfamily)
METLQSLQWVHLLIFLAFFLLMFVFEYYFPLREKKGETSRRWIHNWSLSLFNTSIVRFLSFVTPLSFALYVEKSWWGILNIFELPFFLELCFTILVLDFCIYLQHVASHKWNWFWKFHQIHHSDVDLDVSTALRFHIWEIFISMLYKILLIWLFGFSVIWIVIFEIILVCSAIFNHANFKLPNNLEKYMSYMFVTPQFHQVHHSVIHTQTDSNYGFFFSFWDRLFHTYTEHHFFVKKLGLNYSKKKISFRELILLRIKKK